MPISKAVPINVTDKQRFILEKLSNRKKIVQELSERVNIIIEASYGKDNTKIAQKYKCSRNKVILWRNRWHESEEKLKEIELKKDDKKLTQAIVEVLSDEERAGSPSKFSAEQVVMIVALACEEPKNSNRPITHWSNRELADESQKRGIVEKISPRSIGRFLKGSKITTA